MSRWVGFDPIRDVQVHRRGGHPITPHQLVPAVHVDMVLVAVMALAMLLGPPRVGVLLGTLDDRERERCSRGVFLSLRA